MPTVCVTYIHAQEDAFLTRSLASMASYDWILRFVVLHTDRNAPRRWDEARRTLHVYENFGRGFDCQPEEGGLDEVSARNRSLELAEQQGTDWTMICDADEFYMPAAYTAILQAVARRQVAIWYPCFHFCSLTEYLWDENCYRNVLGMTGLMDPHVRAFRTDRRFRYRGHDNRDWLAQLPNRTLHCGLQVPHNTASAAVAPAEQVMHVHTRHMFRDKRNKDTVRTTPKRIAAGLVMPEAIREAWLAEQVSE